ncbi:hypothetical protein ACHAW6_009157 [Cyclotella cf. meneghiniana]
MRRESSSGFDSGGRQSHKEDLGQRESQMRQSPPWMRMDRQRFGLQKSR